MTVAAGHFSQTQTVGFNQPHASFAGTVGELAHARVSARHIKKDF
jgi:hypothetical protein